MRMFAVAALGTQASCSLILNFSDSAGVHDAAPPDSFYTAAECAYDEPNDTPQTATPIVPGNYGPAAICPTGSDGSPDLDYYTFAVPDGTTAVTITMMYMARGSTGDLNLDLYDATATEIASEDDFNTTKVITCPSSATPICAALGSGNYTFEVSPSLPGNVNDYTFSLAITGSAGSGSGSD